jgi:acid phosphatase (class A)
MRARLSVGLIAALVVVGCVSSSLALEQQGGYLHGAAVPDTASILPAAPSVESPSGAADRGIFKVTRTLKDTPRWALAQSDANEGITAMLRDFSCAAGAGLNEANAPRLTAILRKLGPDILTAVERPKTLYQRKRPYLIDEGEICVAKSPDLARNPDYPSGHATWGWTIGLLLAELAPERASPILSRARAFGESRVVCGVHNASAIEAGRMNGAALVAALHGDAAFRADMDGARAEMAALRGADAPRPRACAAEEALTAHRPW